MSYVMTKFARLAPAAVLAVSLSAGAPTAAYADSQSSDPDALLEEGTKKILRAFELFIMTIPQYEMPEVLPNGDIIIRRKNPPAEKDGDKPAESDGLDKTKT